MLQNLHDSHKSVNIQRFCVRAAWSEYMLCIYMFAGMLLCHIILRVSIIILRFEIFCTFSSNTYMFNKLCTRFCVLLELR